MAEVAAMAKGTGGEIVAEFQEVMKQWKRKCEHCTDDDTVCNINSIVCGAFCEMKNFTKFALVEKDVMSWAAEHPQPVYPTWGEVLVRLGVLKKGWEHTYAAGSECLLEATTKRIDKETAMKLGIEPKEG